MHNVLFAPPSEAELVATLEATARSPGVLPAHDDPVWSEVRARPLVASVFRAVCERAASEAAEPMPVLSDELYADFFRTGERLSFERVYFERRRRLARAAMALLLDPEADRARLAASLAAKLGDLLEEPSWSLPAHVWTEPTGKNPLQIDLKVAETANFCAELVTTFRDLLPPELIARTRARLREQVFENYARRHAEIHWTTLPMNWNAVCHQGVIGAALTLEDDPALIARMLAPALRGLPVFLRGFGDDGTTSEGPNYWTYGFGWFCELNAQVERRSAGRWSLVEGDAHIARIARFAPLMSFAGGHLVNFSDGNREGRLPPWLLAGLGGRLEDPLLRAEAAAGYAHLASTGVDPDAHSSEFFQLARLALRAPAAASAGAAEPDRPDVFFPDYGAIVARGRDARGRRWEFAAKGGHNDEHHNHNDCGSFLLNVDGAPALFEIGAPEYVRRYFGPERYTFLASRSLGHSVPFVNGVEQAAGREFAAEVRDARTGEDRVEFVVDLTRCYPAEANCRSLVRSCVFEKCAGRLTVSDAYDLAAPGEFESVLICREDAILVGAEARIPVAGGRPALRIVPAAGLRWTGPEICDYRDRFGALHRVARLRLRTLDGTSAARGVAAFTVLAE